MRGEKIDSSVLSSTTGPSDFDDVKDFEKAEPSIPGVSIGYDDEEYALEGSNGAWVPNCIWISISSTSQQHKHRDHIGMLMSFTSYIIISHALQVWQPLIRSVAICRTRSCSTRCSNSVLLCMLYFWGRQDQSPWHLLFDNYLRTSFADTHSARRCVVARIID